MLRGMDAIAVEQAKLNRDELRVFLPQDHRPELPVAPAALVQRLGSNRSLESCAQTLAFLFVALKPSLISFRKDEQDLVGLFDVAAHPLRPAFIGVLDVQINPGSTPSLRN
jgi:hypothetical protein